MTTNLEERITSLWKWSTNKIKQSILFFALLTPVYGQTNLIYKVNVPQNERTLIEQKVKFLASKYMQKPYADKEPCDFLQKEYVNICIVNFDDTKYISTLANCDVDKHLINIDYFNVPPTSSLFEICIIHELAHLYDYINGRDLDEGHACKKEYLYMNEIKNSIPLKYFTALKKLEPKKKSMLNSWEDVYKRRGIILDKWSEELRRK